MKNKRSHSDQSKKGVIAASVIGVSAVAVAAIAAYGAAAKNLVRTENSSPESLWSYSAPRLDIPVQNSVGSSSKETPSSKPSSSSEYNGEEKTEPVNRPISISASNIMPVEGEIDKPFSNGELVKSETLGVWKTHDGVDILCELGTDVLSMSEGVVREIRDDPLLGVYVVIEQSNGLEAHYCGLAKELCVKAGQQVKQGELIGKTSDTNQSEILQKPHLHFGVKENGNWIDPLSVM